MKRWSASSGPREERRSWIRRVIVLTAALSVVALPSARAQVVEQFVLENGLVVIVESDPDSRTEAFELFIRVGVADEPPEQSGLTNLVQHLLLKATETRDAAAIASAIEDVGGILEAEAETDMAHISCLVTADVYETGLEVLSDVVLHPTFPEDELEKERATIIAEIGAREDQSFDSGYLRLRQAMYGDHPYSRSPLGTTASVSRLTRDDVVAHYRNYFRARNMVLAVAGGVAVPEVIEEIERLFASLPSGDVDRRPSLDVLWPDERREYVYDREILQSFVFLGYPGANAASDDYARLKLLDAVLSGGMSSRLFVNVRDKMGLAYDVGSFIPTRRDVAPFIIYIGTQPATAREAAVALEGEVERVREEPIGEDELKRAKTYLLGRWRVSHQRSLDRAYYRGWFETIGMGHQFDETYPLLIEDVTPEELTHVAQTYLANPTLVVLRPVGTETGW